MKNTKLYKTLALFSSHELNRLHKFIHSPYFNVNERITSLFDILYYHLKSDPDGVLDKNKVKLKIFEPNEKDIAFRKLISDTLKLVEDFIAQEEYQLNNAHKANYLLQGIYKRKFSILYNSVIKTAQRLTRRQAHKSSEYYFYHYQIEKNLFELSDAKLKRGQRSNLDSIIQNLDYFYLSEKLRYYCTILSSKQVNVYDYDILFIKEIIEHLEKTDYSDHPEVAVYFHIIKLYEDLENVNHYQTIKSILAQSRDVFPAEELQAIYVYLINYCIARANKGDQGFLKELYKVYRDALEFGVLIIDDQLSPWTFKNITTAALRVGEFEWTEGFIKKYAQYIPEGERENALLFNRARLNYYQKDFNAVLQLISQVEFTDFSYNLTSKAMVIASLYELEEFDFLDSYLQAFNTYLQRHKNSLPKSRRANYKNLIKYTKKLMHVIPKDTKAIDDLENDINTHVKVKSDRQWLNEKLDALR